MSPGGTDPDEREDGTFLKSAGDRLVEPLRSRPPERCLICERPIGAEPERFRLREGAYVHRRCAVYRRRRFRDTESRLGSPR